MGNETKETKVGLQSPWVTYFKMMYNVLSADPEITMPDSIEEGPDGQCTIYIESSNEEKIISLYRILKEKIVMGNITVTVKFSCKNEALEFDIKGVSDPLPTVEDYDNAFSGNPYFVMTQSIEMPGGGSMDYAVFTRDIITFFNDNMMDYKCNSHYIVADIIMEISGESSVGVSTEFPDPDKK